MTHAFVPLAIAVGLGKQRIDPRVALAGAVMAILPDADVAGFRLGVEYADNWGHRGASHSLIFSACVTGLLALIWPKARTIGAIMFLFLAGASHGLLDMLTDGGLGVALYWPFENNRHFAPWTPIRVSPIGGGFFSARGAETMLSEIVWICLPILPAAIALRYLMRRVEQ